MKRTHETFEAIRNYLMNTEVWFDATLYLDGKCWTQYDNHIEGLSDDERTMLRDRLEAAIDTAQDAARDVIFDTLVSFYDTDIEEDYDDGEDEDDDTGFDADVDVDWGDRDDEIEQLRTELAIVKAENVKLQKDRDELDAMIPTRKKNRENRK